jgi:hypothetical protein
MFALAHIYSFCIFGPLKVLESIGENGIENSSGSGRANDIRNKVKQE